MLITGSILAQEGTVSPYSYYGIGIQKFRSTAENRSMGGLGVFTDSIHINLQNPASFSSLRLVNLSLGGSHEATSLKNSTESHSASSTTINYLAMGIPMGKMGMGFGLMPYTSVGYHFYSVIPDGFTEYSGNGGLNKAFLSFAYQITPEFSLGVDGNYNFGKIENKAISQKKDLEYGTQEYNSSELRGFNFKIGVLYKKMISKKLEITGSATYSPSTKIKSDNIRKLSTVSILPVGIFPVDETEMDLGTTKYTLPSQFSVGAGISNPKHWAVGAEYSLKEESDFSNRALVAENISYKSASRFSLGGYYIPNYSAFGKYFERVVYRAGFRYEETGLSVSGHNINEFGISFGLGLPVGRLFSNINVGIEVGRRGTKDYGLIQENFFNTFLSFSLNDRWFEKRLYD